MKTVKKRIGIKKWIGALLIILLLLFIFYFSFNDKQPANNSNERVVAFVLDGADWRVVNKLLADGRLENIKYLIDNGASGRIQSVQPIYTPPNMASLFSGKLPSKHGIKSHFDVTSGNTKNQVYRNMKVKPLWKILDNKNITMDIVGFLEIDYAPKIDGTMVGGFYLIKKVAAYNNYFSNVNKELSFLKYIPDSILVSKKDGDILKDYGFLNNSAQIMAEKGIYLNFNNQITYLHIPNTIKNLKYAEERKKGNLEFSKLIKGIQTIFDSNVSAKFIFEFDALSKEISLDLFKRHKSNIAFFYFQGTDVFSHNYYFDGWKVKDKNNQQEQLYKYYELMDEYIGEFIKNSEENTTFMVISDHGAQDTTMSRYLYAIPHEPPHTKYGIFIAKGKNIKQSYKVYNLRMVDIVPTLLYMYDQPIAKDFDGKVLKDIFYENYTQSKNIRYIYTYE